MGIVPHEEGETPEEFSFIWGRGGLSLALWLLFK